MSTVCSSSTMHSPPSLGQTGRTSIAILCHDASKSLWPSSKLDMPAFPLHGSNFRKGVKFSVQTTSLGNVPCRRWRFDKEAFEWSPVGSKVTTGLVVRVESIKLSEAQNKPETALVRVVHLANALGYCKPNVSPIHDDSHTRRPSLPPPRPKAQPQSLPPLPLPMALRPNSLHPNDQC